MNSQPLISIAMCTYNGIDFLSDQLDSILAQSYQNWELVVVDDCSADVTRDILASYAAREPRITVHCNDRNLGYNKNFEKAVTLCRGDLIAVCDQDDIWHPDKLQMQFDLLGDNMLVYHDSEFIDRQGNSMNRKISEKFNFYRGSRPEAFLYLNCVSGHSILMKRELVDISLPFPTDFHYDQWLAFNAARVGSIDFLPDCLVRYRQHGNNNTDLLALHTGKRQARDIIIGLERESHWLLLCAEKSGGVTSALIRKLYQLSIRRNDGFFTPEYGMLIWKHRGVLLSLLKKSDTSKLFYTLRKTWGAKAKTIAQ